MLRKRSGNSFEHLFFILQTTDLRIAPGWHLAIVQDPNWFSLGSKNLESQWKMTPRKKTSNLHTVQIIYFDACYMTLFSINFTWKDWFELELHWTGCWNFTWKDWFELKQKRNWIELVLKPSQETGPTNSTCSFSSVLSVLLHGHPFIWRIKNGTKQRVDTSSTTTSQGSNPQRIQPGSFSGASKHHLLPCAIGRQG